MNLNMSIVSVRLLKVQFVIVMTPWVLVHYNVML
jgi:hypothetical protein